MILFIHVFIFLTIAEGRIIGAFQVCRHGARAPLEAFAWDKSQWKVNPGELTQEGLMQMYLLGKEFRSRYITQQNFVNQSFNMQEIYIRSTDVTRTIMSSQGNLMGLFPNGPQIKKNMATQAVPPFPISNLEQKISEIGDYALPNRFQPVPIDVYPQELDHLLLGYSKSCKKIEKNIALYQVSDEYKAKVEESKEFLVNLESILSLEKIPNEAQNFERAAFIGDSLTSIKYHGYQLPEGITEEILEKLYEIRDFCNSYLFNNDGAILASSEFYLRMITFFEDIKNGKTEKK